MDRDQIIKKGKYYIVHTHSSEAEIIGRIAARLMNALVTRDDLYKEAIKNSLKRRELFSWNYTAKRTLDIYKNVGLYK